MADTTPILLEVLEERVLCAGDAPEDPLPPPDFTPAGPHFVYNLYHDLFHREPDTGGLYFWLGLLQAGASPANVALGFLRSKEYLNGRIAREYTAVFGPGHAVDTASWLKYLQTHTVDQMEGEFFGSDEYFRRAGRTNAEFINDVYLNLLNRFVDPAGLGYWWNKLQQGLTRSEVAYEILRTPEAARRVAAGLYATYLHRAPDAGPGLDYWTNQLSVDGKTEVNVIDSLVSSDEYIMR